MGHLRALGVRHPYLSALAVIAVFWSLLLGISGASFTGYQLVDDHEILQIQRDLNAPGATYFKVLAQRVQDDMKTRFRPLYWVHRVAAAAVLGPNFILWGVHHGLIAAATSLMLFAFCYRLKFAWTEALLLPLITLAGPQMAIYWRFGPQETYGMAFLAAALLFMALALESSAKRRLYDVLFIVAVLAMSLCKESFILMVPALAFWRVWATMEQTPGASWRQAIRRNTGVGIAAAVILMVTLGFILFGLGTTKTAYAGVDKLQPWSVLECVWRSFYAVDYFVVGAGALALAWYGVLRRRSDDAEKVRHYLVVGPVLILCLVILVPQGFLYARTAQTLQMGAGMFERYRLPAFLAFSFSAVWLRRRLRDQSGRVALLFGALLLAWCVMEIGDSWQSARDWAQRGQLTHRFFREVESDTKPETAILLVGDPARNPEETLSTKLYLEDVMRREDLVLTPVFNPPYSVYEKELIAEGQFMRMSAGHFIDKPASARPFECVVVMRGCDPILRKNMPTWLTGVNYDRHGFGGPQGMAVYNRRPGR